MRIAVFGGSFNPPHNGHVRAVQEARKLLCAEKALIIPSAAAPHKAGVEGSPTPEERLLLAKLAFGSCEGVNVSDLEVARGGVSYTVDTLEALRAMYPEDELILLMGADMLMCFDRKWRAFERILELAALGVFSREKGQDGHLDEAVRRLRSLYGARIEEAGIEPVEISSTQLRELLCARSGREFLPENVYSEIIRRRWYGAKPELSWLRGRVAEYMDEKRLRHVIGCEEEAASLAVRWGLDPQLAAEAGILHDITKKLNAVEQLKLCAKYGIITDIDERESYKLLHSKTGAELAREEFGIGDEVYGAIAWHTTGRPNMTELEKLIYIADYIEPNRSFDGLDRLRRLAYENLDEAVLEGLEMSLDELERHGKKPHESTLNALKSMRESRRAAKRCNTTRSAEE